MTWIFFIICEILKVCHGHLPTLQTVLCLLLCQGDQLVLHYFQWYHPGTNLVVLVSSLTLCSLFRNFGINFFWSKLKMWHSDMVHQSTFIHCTEIAFGALEIKKQSLSSMSRLHMCGQIFLLRKIFFAIGTSKYLSSRTIALHVVFNIVHCETLEIAMITTDLFQISIVWVGPI